MRLVLFGDSTRHAGLLEDVQVRAGIHDVIRGHPITVPADPASAIEGGLLARDGSHWSLGPEVIRAPEIDDAQLQHSIGAASAAVHARIPELRKSSQAAGYLDWPGISLLLIGGVLLELFVGMELRNRKLVSAVPDRSRVWVLPDYSGPTVSMRCRYEREPAVGAALMWVGEQPDLSGWPPAADISIWLHSHHASTEWAAAALRLRRARWLTRAELNVLRLSQGDPLWGALERTAKVVVAAAHQPLLSALPGDPDSRLIVSRRIFEGVLQDLAAKSLIAIRPDIQRRFTWDGPDLQQ